MKLATIEFSGNEYSGIIHEDKLYPFASLGFPCTNMNDFLVRGGVGELQNLYKKIGESSSIFLADAKLLAPIPEPRQDIICLGLNYLGHAEEAKNFNIKTEHKYPIYFSKRVNRSTNPGDILYGHFDVDNTLDYEAELGVIIGKDTYKIAPEDVFGHILGYTIINDVSARKLQKRHSQWYLCKSLDGYAPMGPYIVTEDQFSRPPELNIETRVNGTIYQSNNTKNLVFGLERIISELSNGMLLKAGTIIATGTPEGIGKGKFPPEFLVPGDTVECEIENIGILRNTVQ